MSAPTRQAVAVTSSGIAVLDCGHVRPATELRRGTDPAQLAPETDCWACASEAAQACVEYNVKRGDGV